MEKLDDFDRKIVEELQKCGRITVTDLAKKVGLSKTPCQIRMKKLEDAGYILGYRAEVDHTKLGAGHIAFVQVKLNDTRSRSLEAFNAAAREIPEIEECHMIASGFDYLLKVRTRDIGSYRRVLGEKLSEMPYVAQTSTFVCMEQVKDRPF
ncbi:Leucine-responsive regulatory protein [Pseudovibrio sp. W64]|jgi:Lrp/AsnC family leucine-responsive transcriptional regulator|uniref:Lrp/AsnC family transcriptional regulator, leucine-responsive regulatory protein n=2 Tax=Pseudovibrio TaxID=258255 RepID=A0A1I3YK99_9HYPH|nr:MULTISPECIES: Lrp/AsnC ligand binding domain-containing protein [unclassified Pseudovibrio]KZK79192.1 Leucine-responsive regulatory protein [Pseudovibrio sp. W64]KZL22253.1 Leucine-responsive regulatory protein [Pseudovibrio sp. WM33]SFK31701.1 Lrp/AsnC family transcriptional regulator, leucine-responsive regulatory protein [Pseudovibrio ascidiaceicola]